MGQPIFEASNDNSARSQRATRNPNSSALLGERLLQGWRMLADCCPDCAVPLMQPRGEVVSLCVSCDLHFPAPPGEGPRLAPAQGQAREQEQEHPEAVLEEVEDPGPAFNALEAFSIITGGARTQLPPYPTLRPPATGVAPQANGLHAHGGETGETASTSDDDDAIMEAFRERERNMASQRETLLAGIAAETPQAQTPSTIPTLPQPAATAAPSDSPVAPISPHPSVSDPRPRNLPTPLVVEEGTLPEVGKVSPQSQPEGERWPDASGEMADLMLQGWKLLANHCPRCLNPLLESREGRIRCPGCKLWVVAEGSTPPAPAVENATMPERVPAGAHAASQPTPGPDATAVESRAEGHGQDVGCAEEGPLRASGAEAMPTAGATSGDVASGPVQGSRTIVGQATAAVLETMAEASSALTDLSVGPESCSEFVRLIGDCARALKALEDL